MSRPRKLLGIETDIWALMTPEGQILAGDWRPRIFWTKALAKQMRRLFPTCAVVPVRIVLVKRPSETRRPRP